MSDRDAECNLDAISKKWNVNLMANLNVDVEPVRSSIKVFLQNGSKDFSEIWHEV
jgi:hypothetical protein